MKRPDNVVICGKRYSISYVPDMVKADIDRRSPCWGQIDPQTRSIRLYEGEGDHKRQPEDILDTLIHEVLHGILSDTKWLRHCLKDEGRNGVEEVVVDQLANQVADTFVRNGWLTLEDE